MAPFPMNLSGKTALVTGGERGIGRGIVKGLLRHGMRVCIAGMDRTSAAQTLDDLNAGERLIFEETDVRDEDAVKAAVQSTVRAFGSLDALVANAGIAEAHCGPVESLSLDEWNTVLATNLTGPFLCARHALPELRANGGGSIILIASTRALQSEPDTAAYSASKGGLVALAHSLAMSCGPLVRVNAVSPGWIHTGAPDALREVDHQQHPVGRVGAPRDIASMTAFLLSEEAGFISGQNIVVDGGMTPKMIYRH